MAAMVENSYLDIGIAQGLAIRLGRTYRNNQIFTSPDDMGGQSSHPFEKVRESGVVQYRFPCQPSVFRASIFKRLELLRRTLSAIEFVVFGGGVVIINTGAERGSRSD